MNQNNWMGLVADERNVRLYGFLVVFFLMAFWEQKASRRKEKVPRVLRWPNNLGLGLLNHFLVRALFPGAVLWAANLAAQYRFGFFQWVEVPLAFSVVWTVLLLDAVVYYQHRAFHAIPLLWKLHRMHHTDLEVDVTTGARFHTLEIFASIVIKASAVALLGAPVIGVFLFELILGATTLFNHSNIRIADRLEKCLRWAWVTPDMHRVHHSAVPAETNSNFGFNLSLWDRLFGTYRRDPQQGQEKMKIGLEFLRDSKYLALGELLKIPFLDKEGRFAWGNLTKEK
ncbi:MAG TPA: sterol desaturase family protein [bacterium]|jgi:sterol desaturase/sphingolipid hydroxylase (fatty acid hydroxylase superfamily)|nr:sterol desaturase family protein [bacterium]